MNTNSHNNTEDHTPQHTHRGTEMWGRRESGRALMLAATKPPVIRQLRVMGHRWRTQPRQDSEIETDLVASAILHTTTTTQGQGEVGEAKEWEGTDVGSNRTTSDPATEREGHQWRTRPHQDLMIETDLVASASKTTSPAASLTPLRIPPPPRTVPQRQPLQLRQRRTNTDTNNGGTRSPMQQQ